MRLRPDLKPKSLVRVLDQAFELYRANFKTVALATAAVLFPLALLMSLAQVFYYRGFLELVAEIFTQAAQGGPEVLTSPEDLLGLTHVFGRRAGHRTDLLGGSRLHRDLSVRGGSAHAGWRAGHRARVPATGVRAGVLGGTDLASWSASLSTSAS